jgi:hypothetical protein
MQSCSVMKSCSLHSRRSCESQTAAGRQLWKNEDTKDFFSFIMYLSIVYLRGFKSQELSRLAAFLRFPLSPL